MELQQEFLDEIKNIYGQDSQIILKAFEFANKKHSGQYRDTGDEYITHPFETARILINMRADIPTVVSGLLHDCIEDTDCTEKEIFTEFGDEIGEIVLGASKIEPIKHSHLQNENENENLHKMFLTMSKDARVALVKLADRLHNMRTLEVKNRVKQIKIAKETMDIFVPIAERLGMSKFKRDLENLCFKYLLPAEYVETEKFMEETYKKREKIITDITETIKKLAREHNIQECRVQSRIKSNFGVYTKQQKKGKDGVYDIVAHRIIVKEIKDCYTMLGAVHNQWKPVEGRIKDYIANPKKNLYRSLHTTVLYPLEVGTIPFEIQIRTEEMHNFCEYGIAAHWIYKDGGSKNTKIVGNTKMLEKSQESSTIKQEDNEEDFMEIIKTGFYANKIFVFTPKLNVVQLQEGSNAIDMAYYIHSGLGNKCTGAKVNGKMVPLDTELITGDIVEILTSPNSKGPSKDWLKIVKMQSTKDKINVFFRKEMREENIKKGKSILEQAAKGTGVPWPTLLDDEYVPVLLEKLSMKDMDEIYASVGHGSLASIKVINRLTNLYEQYKKQNEIKVIKTFSGDKREKTTDLSGLSGIMTKLAKCCNPVPGDEIVGYVSRGRGVTIHRVDCSLLNNLEQDRLMPINWGKTNAENKYTAVITIVAKNSPTTLASISNKLAENKINISYIYSDTNKSNDAVYHIGIEVKSKQELNEFINKLKAMQEIYDVTR